VETLTPDLDAALRFYEGVFGWSFAGPGPMPGDPPGAYFVARVDGDDVAGVGSLPARAGEAGGIGWSTHVAVASADDAAARAVDAGGTLLLEPFDVPPAGRLAVIADPAGAAFCVWEAGARAGARRVNEPSAWAMSLLRTPDPSGAEAFYGDLFGWRAEQFGPDGGLWLWRLPGYVGGEPSQPVPRDVVAGMLADEGGPAAWGVDFWVADADAAVEPAAQLGGRVVVEPFADAPFRRAILSAPDGATFSISQLQLAG
jgi:predicted enzyme related to lactoylglutathione lyase